MKWETHGDEHILCDDRGVPSEYRVLRDPVSGLYRAYDGNSLIMARLSIEPCKQVLEHRYKNERFGIGQSSSQGKRGRNTKRGAA